MIADIRKQVESLTARIQIDFGQVIGDMLGDLMESVQPIEIKIYGNSNKNLTNFQKKLETLQKKSMERQMYSMAL